MICKLSFTLEEFIISLRLKNNLYYRKKLRLILKSSYKDAGVDIKAGDETVSRIKNFVKSTLNKNVLTGIGHFGAYYELDIKNFNNPVMVSSVDGVGTKLKVAFKMDKHDTVGQDLVNHCVNDIAVCGAQPLYFMDYLAFGKLYPDKAEKIIEGFSVACKENNVALIGGETAEMPGMYQEDEYDMSGTIVGIIEKDEIIDGSSITSGDSLVGFPSNGLHTNGYSLARKVLFEKYSVDQKLDAFECTLGEELLKIHKSYLNLISGIKKDVKAFSHITGGGIIGNTKRVVPENLKISIDWNSWDQPNIFKLIQETGDVHNEEMRKTFNLGIGLIAIVNKSNVELVLNEAESIGEKGLVIGKII